METRKLLWGALASLMLVSACQEKELDIYDMPSGSNGRQMKEVVITADLDGDQTPSDTRTSLELEGTKNLIYWSPGDELKIFSAGEESKFTAQITEKSRKAKFNGLISFITGDDGEAETDYVWGLYPYRDDATYSEPDGNSRTALITTTLPGNQSGKDNTFEDGLAITIGRSESPNISFKSVYTSFYVTFKERTDIISLTFRGLDNEALAGRFSVGMTENGNTLTPEVKSISEPVTEITLMAPENGTFKTDTRYYLVMLPVSFQNGFSITAYTNDGLQGTYAVSRSTSFDRNTSYKSTNLDTKITEWVAASTQSLNEIWYTTTDGNPISYRVPDGSSNKLLGQIVPADNGGTGIIRFASALQKVDDRAFFGQHRLLSVYLPQSVTTIGTSAFTNCDELTEVIMGPSVKEIQENAFSGCAFETINLQEGLESIGPGAFRSNRNLKHITIPETVTHWGPDLIPHDYNPFESCPSLTSFEGKFATDDGLALVTDGVLIAYAIGAPNSSYTIPDGVETIGYSAFSRAKLSSVDLNGVTNILNGAFVDSELRFVSLPSTVKWIDNWAFAGCTKMESISIDVATSLPMLGEYEVFDNTNDCPIYVPAAWVQVFKTTAPWKTYADRIQVRQESTEIWYITTDGEVVPTILTYFNQYENLTLENEYKDGLGIIRFKQSDGEYAPITEIPNWLFLGAGTLKTVSLPEGLEYIGDSAFGECTALESIILPGTLKGIGVFVPSSAHSHVFNSFEGCTSLTAFYGVGDHFQITGDNRFLLSQNGEYLISGAMGAFEGEACTIPEEVKIIGPGALMGGKSSELILPESLEEIAGAAFMNYTLTEGQVWIPSSVTEIGPDAFYLASIPSGVWFQSENLPNIGYRSFGWEERVVPIHIPGAATLFSGNLLKDETGDESMEYDSWFDYRNKDMIHVFQGPREIWYHIKGSISSMPLGSDYNFGSESSPAHIAGNSFVIFKSIYKDLSPDIPFPDDSFDYVGVFYFDGQVLSIPDQAFKDRSSIDYMSISSVNKIGNEAFSGCTELMNFPLSATEGLNTIGDNAFENCTAMKAADLDLRRVTSLGSGVFKNCESLTFVTLENVTTIPEETFYGCSSLTFVGPPKGKGEVLAAGVHLANVTEVGDCAFTRTAVAAVSLSKATRLGASAFSACQQLKTVTLPKATSLGVSCFYSSNNLESVSIPKVQTLGNECFGGLQHKLSELALPAVKTIGANALGKGSQLTRVVIGQNIESLTASLFAEYSDSDTKPSSFTLYMSASTAPRISDDTFANLRLSGNKVTFQVVLGSEKIRTAYKNAWDSFFPFKQMSSALDQIFVVSD